MIHGSRIPDSLRKWSKSLVLNFLGWSPFVEGPFCHMLLQQTRAREWLLPKNELWNSVNSSQWLIYMHAYIAFEHLNSCEQNPQKQPMRLCVLGCAYYPGQAIELGVGGFCVSRTCVNPTIPSPIIHQHHDDDHNHHHYHQHHQHHQPSPVIINQKSGWHSLQDFPSGLQFFFRLNHVCSQNIPRQVHKEASTCSAARGCDDHVLL